MPDSCPKCGKPIEAGEVRCPACAADLPPVAVNQPNKALVVLAVLLPTLVVILLLGGITVIAYKLLAGHHSPPPPPVTMDSPPPAHAPPVNTSPAAPVVVLPSAPAMPVVPTAPQAPSVPSAPKVPAAPAEPFTPPPPVAVVNVPAPSLTDFDPAITGPGTTLTLHGDGLKAVNRVLLISSHGAQTAKAPILSQKDDKQLQIAIPDVPFADFGIVIAVFSPGGVAILADQHTLSAESYSPDSHPHDSAVSVHGGDEIFAGDHMVIFARPGADVSLGNDCIAFLSENVRLKAMGKRCRVWMVPADALQPGVSRDGLSEIKALSLNFENDAFRVKPAPPGQDQ